MLVRKRSRQRKSSIMRMGLHEVRVSAIIVACLVLGADGFLVAPLARLPAAVSTQAAVRRSAGMKACNQRFSPCQCVSHATCRMPPRKHLRQNHGCRAKDAATASICAKNHLCCQPARNNQASSVSTTGPCAPHHRRSVWLVIIMLLSMRSYSHTQTHARAI